QDVRADLVAPADVALARGFRFRRLAPLLQLELVEARAQHGEGLGPVAVLRAVVLTGDHDAGRQMGQADGAVGLVDVLPAGARGAVGVDAQILFVDLDLDAVVDHRVDPDAGEAGVAPRLT